MKLCPVNATSDADGYPQTSWLPAWPCILPLRPPSSGRVLGAHLLPCGLLRHKTPLALHPQPAPRQDARQGGPDCVLRCVSYNFSDPSQINNLSPSTLSTSDPVLLILHPNLFILAQMALACCKSLLVSFFWGGEMPSPPLHPPSCLLVSPSFSLLL